ncbi:Protein of unknown function [Gryllus bimaculatus]|nr:Protein of unknown function [Gryllus bimaculatus]
MVMDPWLFRPPVLVGERVVWLGSGSGLPQGGVVRWIGKLPEMGPDWTVGLQLDNPLPYGGIDGTWGNRHLFTCEPKHGLIVPITKTVREADLLSWPFNSHVHINIGHAASTRRIASAEAAWAGAAAGRPAPARSAPPTPCRHPNQLSSNARQTVCRKRISSRYED